MRDTEKVQKHIGLFIFYPRHPEANGNLERFNRTIRDQFTSWSGSRNDLNEPTILNYHLMDYLIW